MASTFTWLDYSERDRKKMLEIIHAFSENDTRDELGIGTIRDGLADMLFPGTGTVQTRARYFLFIPWIYLELEECETPTRDISRKARSREIELIYGLEAGGETRGGVIGSDAREKLQRLPSNIYWQGLGLWGLRTFAGSQEQYHRWLDRWYQTNRERTRPDRNESYDDGGAYSNWHLAMPRPDRGWRQKSTFSLTHDEARFLRDCILNKVPDSLLAHLVMLDQSLDDSAFCWESEACAGFPANNKIQVDHARNFSEVMHGAAVLYNLFLAEKSGKRDLIREYRDLLGDWSDMIKSGRDRLTKWDRGEFWRILQSRAVGVSSRTQSFVTGWVDLVMGAERPSRLMENGQARLMIRQRESDLKKGLARLENPRALELWTGAAGMGRLDFRWNRTRQIVNDILEGLGHA